jgi:hypothetical protein
MICSGSPVANAIRAGAALVGSVRTSAETATRAAPGPWQRPRRDDHARRRGGAAHELATLSGPSDWERLTDAGCYLEGLFGPWDNALDRLRRFVGDDG